MLFNQCIILNKKIHNFANFFIMLLYHYTTIDTFTKIWISEELQFHEYKNMNDLYERQKFAEIEIPGRINMPKHIKSFKGGPLGYFFTILSKYQQISFCKDYISERGCFSPMMWGLYARNENGICLEFDKNRLLEKVDVYNGSVKYMPVKPIPLVGIDFESDDNIEKAIIRNRKEIFFAKHPHWRAENEYRVIARNLSALSIKRALTCIYLQEPMNKDAELNIKLVEKLVEGNSLPIRFIGVRYDNEYCKLRLIDR